MTNNGRRTDCSMFTDTHSHPYLADTESEARNAVRAALSAGVDRIIMPNVDLNSITPMKSLADAFPDNLRMAMGLHPTEVREDADEILNTVETELSTGVYVAVGEIGMDLYWDKTYEREQMSVFHRQLQYATDMKLPVIIHCREALNQTLEVLSAFPQVHAVFHSFGGSAEDVARIRRVGDYYFGINGIVTFKNSKLSEVLPVIGAERLLLETDSPYLAPVPYRGKPNQSAYLPYVAAKVADSMGMSLTEIAQKTSANSIDLFGF